MKTFEEYAEGVISGLSKPDDINLDQLQSPLEGILNDLNGHLIELNDVSQVQRAEEILETQDIYEIENGVLASGIDSLAFYKSIHYKSAAPFKGKWGIFIFDHALTYLSQEISDFYPKKYTHSQCIENSFWLLYFHERFHFRFDCWVISHESATSKPLYENYRNSVYRTCHPSELVYEETLANLHSLSSIARYGIHEFARQFMLSQPGAYSNITGINRDDFRSRLAAQLFHGRNQLLRNPFTLPEHNQYLANPKNTALLDKECPLFLVQGISASRFVVPNISLPTVSDIKDKYLKKYLNGKNITTDHTYFKIDNGEKVKCPNPHNKNVKLKEFNNIVKKSGLTIKQYFEEKKNTRNWKKDVPRETAKPSLL